MKKGVISTCAILLAVLTAGCGLLDNEDNIVTECEIPEGLVAYYPFNGNAEDQSGYGHTGVVSGATLTQDRFGRENRAYEFNGSNSEIRIWDPPYCSDDFSIAFWSKRLDRSKSHFLISGGEMLNLGYADPPGVFRFSLYLDDLDTPDSHTDVDDAWHFWAVTYEAESRTRTIYKDGALVATDTASGDYSGIAMAYIGRGWDTGTVLHGMLDEVRVYDRALSPSEVSCVRLVR
jgi:hypothetical protein